MVCLVYLGVVWWILIILVGIGLFFGIYGILMRPVILNRAISRQMERLGPENAQYTFELFPRKGKDVFELAGEIERETLGRLQQNDIISLVLMVGIMEFTGRIPISHHGNHDDFIRQNFRNPVTDQDLATFHRIIWEFVDEREKAGALKRVTALMREKNAEEDEEKDGEETDWLDTDSEAFRNTEEGKFYTWVDSLTQYDQDKDQELELSGPEIDLQKATQETYESIFFNGETQLEKGTSLVKEILEKPDFRDREARDMYIFCAAYGWKLQGGSEISFKDGSDFVFRKWDNWIDPFHAQLLYILGREGTEHSYDEIQGELYAKYLSDY